MQQRDDYTCLLNRIEELADIKDGEAKQYVIYFISSFILVFSIYNQNHGNLNSHDRF